MPDAPLDRRWVSLEDAAAIIGRSPRTLRRWVTDGRLTPVVVLGRGYVRELELLKVAAKMRTWKPGRDGEC